ncbi:hypothetical protein KFE25_002690 [Diacronema lutheri]|uniref:Uncharacterized protein n=2 Tax=Diacronema lutheri TaxID=2081491 RepID=A0A8J6CF88_DIALT|nr:hypothetical protein KFE25_002690 [Diacronema lutheri]
MRLLLACVLLACVRRSTGWVTKTIGSSKFPMRWSVPESNEDAAGLGAGISWAIADDFGEKMVPLFKENDFRLGYDFVTAESLNDALQRAMFQWASNHKYLNFFNVSDKCTAAEGKDCAVAELYIHAGAGGEEFQWAPVKVFQTFNSTSGARVRTTAGESIDARAIVKSEVKFFTDHPVEAPDFRLGRQCFYLDETFCEPFHREQRKYDLKLMVEVVCFVIWAIAFLMAVKRLLEYVVGYCQKGWEGVKMIMRVHASHILYSYFTMLMLIFPPAFYWVALYPCFLCVSFESIATGAIGQVLGFEYNDAPDVTNYKSTERMSADVCKKPHEYIAESSADTASVVRTPSNFAANYCLTGSDLDGLYHLYPLCSGARVIPGCLRSKTNLGFLRVGLAFGLPFVVTSLVIFVGVAVLRRVEKRASEDVKKRLAVNAFATSSPVKVPKRRQSLGGKILSRFSGRSSSRAGLPRKPSDARPHSVSSSTMAQQPAHAPAEADYDNLVARRV